MKHEGSPLRHEFLERKMKLVRETMEEKGIDLWLIFTREGNEDPLSEDLRFNDLTWRSAALIDVDGSRTAIVGSLEEELVESRRFYSKVVGYGSEGVAAKLKEFLAKRKPRKVAVNTSADLGTADGLSTGMERYLRRVLRSDWRKMVSGEDLAIALRSRLIPEEVKLIKDSITDCEWIYDHLEEAIRPGKRDTDVFELARELMEQRKVGPAWGADHCPSVAVGKGDGHFGHRGTRIEDGDFVRLDFGVRKEGYCSDIQRNYFAGTGAVPREVKRMFDTAVDANEAALSVLKPGVPGYRVDAVARSLIVKRGFPDYKHALGHVLGRSTHEIGPLLGPRWKERYGSQGEKVVAKDMVFTIEPSVAGHDGTCNLEQDVLVTSKGYRELSKPQRSLILLGR